MKRVSLRKTLHFFPYSDERIENEKINPEIPPLGKAESKALSQSTQKGSNRF